ncbi:uncharacterized protein MONBRDRAFT_27059 [Monosiga brevicollis MX1]|uniref:CREG-like beta-barrel domain-containing protein n=1 Tax=Monosiga brevicollis TaxID=81824 RepID=A9V467_MONBE|nr:uncharacterized protein MONBRDRAFT_27059 [Monosiga brevicollis MX1]EDQ87566.1 predicted protein [Monosiga brevicollis MX1]|eukprot:XP_001747486.1 hypothetical protein [Monosiga brevicollis MX1]
MAPSKSVGVLVGLLLLGLAVSAHDAAAGPPDYQDKVGVARWLAHQAVEGVLATTSTAFPGYAFGNTQSFADGTIKNSTGHLFFYVSNLDASIQDILVDPRCTFTLSEVETNFCKQNHYDAEDPRCARLTFVGTYRNVTSAEEPHAQAALFDRHPEMKSWNSQGSFHDFHFTTLEIEHIWLVDMFGGAADVDVKQYYARNNVTAL